VVGSDSIVKLPAVSARTHDGRRAARAVEAFAGAKAAIGPIEPGMSLFLITRGQFSMLDMIQHCLSELGPSSVSIWTWATSVYDEGSVSALIQDRRIVAARLVIDKSQEARNPRVMALWRDVFGADGIRLCMNHAKIARVWNAERRVLIRGSMNLNLNPRFEQADISEGGPAFELVARLEDELPILPAFCSNTDAESATGVNKSFERSTLEMFDGLRVWSK
jgi:hypothetical protein